MEHLEPGGRAARLADDARGRVRAALHDRNLARSGAVGGHHQAAAQPRPDSGHHTEGNPAAEDVLPDRVLRGAAGVLAAVSGDAGAADDRGSEGRGVQVHLELFGGGRFRWNKGSAVRKLWVLFEISEINELCYTFSGLIQNAGYELNWTKTQPVKAKIKHNKSN